MSKQHIYLISDSTGETVQTIVRACAVQFEDVELVEHFWPMVRSGRALDIVLEELSAEPGLVLYSLVNAEVEERLTDFCRRRNVPCVSVLKPFIDAMGLYFKSESRGLPGRQHELDEGYFSRIDAINFVISHDDGQAPTNLSESDVILVGVSRTSKTPTSIYLANRGIKAANVPIVPGRPLPDILFDANRPLVVGLTEDPRRLVEVRRNRMRLQKQFEETDYTDFESIKQEVADSRRLFAKHGWPIIDVTRRSIEETAAAILKLIQDHGKDPGGSAEAKTAHG